MREESCGTKGGEANEKNKMDGGRYCRTRTCARFAVLVLFRHTGGKGVAGDIDLMEVIINVSQIAKVTNVKATVGDVTTVVCIDKELAERLRKVPIHTFHDGKPEKHVMAATYLVQRMLDAEEDIEIENIGESDFILEYAPPKKKNAFFEGAKLVFVSLAVFFGGAFTILTFYFDIGLQDVFKELYAFAGTENPAFPALELGYCFGLPLGILVFFNHFSKLRLSSDPTPLEVQMRSYEKEVNEAIIANASREDNEQDVT